MLGMLDMSILRLLPWMPTEFSKYVNGYPNLFTLHCCMYGNFVALLLQSTSSVLLLWEVQNSNNSLLTFMLVVLSLLLMLKTFVETIVGIQRERSHKMITLLELRRNALPEGNASDNPILTEIPMSVLEFQVW